MWQMTSYLSTHRPCCRHAAPSCFANVCSLPRRVRLQGVRVIVTLECTEARSEGGTPSRYTTQKVCPAAGGSSSGNSSGCHPATEAPGDSQRRVSWLPTGWIFGVCNAPLPLFLRRCRAARTPRSASS